MNLELNALELGTEQRFEGQNDSKEVSDRSRPPFSKIDKDSQVESRSTSANRSRRIWSPLFRRDPKLGRYLSKKK